MRQAFFGVFNERFYSLGRSLGVVSRKPALCVARGTCVYDLSYSFFSSYRGFSAFPQCADTAPALFPVPYSLFPTPYLNLTPIFRSSVLTALCITSSHPITSPTFSSSFSFSARVLSRSYSTACFCAVARSSSDPARGTSAYTSSQPSAFAARFRLAN